MRAVSLFSGCLGLDLGLESAGVETVCFVESEPACQRLIRARRPGVPIVGDVRMIDRETGDELGGVDLVAGGFPCQDLSYAGRGAGLTGERSGLWFEMLRVVEELEPRAVLVENVPALLGRGIGVVLHGLARAGYAGSWFTLAAAQVGAPHLRVRVFIVAVRYADERFTGGHAAGRFDEAGWLPVQESLFGLEPMRKFGRRGRFTSSDVYEDATEEDASSSAVLLPSPQANESTPTDAFVEEVVAAGVDPAARLYLPGRKWHAQRTLSRIVPALLPTPGSNDMNGAEGETRRDRQKNGATGGPSLRDLPRLLPTPMARDDHGPQGASYRGDPSSDLPSAVSRLDADSVYLLPTPTGQDGANNGGPSQHERHTRPLNAEVQLLPTPGRHRLLRLEAIDGRTDEWTSNEGTSLTDAIWEVQGRETDTQGKLLPTPQASDGEGGPLRDPEILASGRRPSGQKATTTLVTATDHLDRVEPSAWGAYAAAVERWQELVGRDAPAPTDAKGRLSPEFVEWMMGFPAGWTETGEKRTARLKMLGNAVQVQVGEVVGSLLAELAIPRREG